MALGSLPLSLSPRCALPHKRRIVLPMTVQASISKRLQQYALAQLDRAIRYLTDARHKSDTAIHETRRCLKRVRALLRLVKVALPAHIYDRDNLYLRNIGRQLAALRDAAVSAETLAALKKEFPAKLPRNEWRSLQESLATALRQSLPNQKKRMGAVIIRLRAARARVEKWALDFDDVAVLQSGLRKAYRRGQRAMEQALETPTATTFHEWRKQVNHLRHQLQLLQTLKLGKVKATLRDFKLLAELLGLKNDLAVLTQQLQSRQRKAKITIPPALQELIQTRATTLTDEAVTCGRQLYQRKPKAFSRSI